MSCAFYRPQFPYQYHTSESHGSQLSGDVRYLCRRAQEDSESRSYFLWGQRRLPYCCITHTGGNHLIRESGRAAGNASDLTSPKSSVIPVAMDCI